MPLLPSFLPLGTLSRTRHLSTAKPLALARTADLSGTFRLIRFDRNVFEGVDDGVSGDHAVAAVVGNGVEQQLRRFGV
jgi:hypothetical protein